MNFWQTLSNLTVSRVTFFVALMFFECAFAGRIFYFDSVAMGKRIDAATTWRDVVPLVADQVRLHIYCAERTELNALEHEFFLRDWDEPLILAGQPKTLHKKLLEAISSLDAHSLVAIDSHVGSDKKNRRIEFDQLCRSWLMMQGKIPKSYRNSRNCKCLFQSLIKVKAHNDSSEGPLDKSPLKKSSLVDTQKVKDEFIGVANFLRCYHEMHTKGMNSFVCYLSCSEKCMAFGQADESEVAAFCRSLAKLVNEHLDAYGVSTSLAFKTQEKYFYLSDIKELLKDSMERFHTLLNFSYEQVEERIIDGEEYLFATSEGRVSKFLAELSEKQKKERAFLLERQLFAEGIQALLEEKEREKSVVKAYSQTGVKEVVVKPKVARPSNWHPPTEEEKAEEAAKEAIKKAKEAVGKLWERFQLIDEVKLVADQSSLPDRAESSSVGVVLSQLSSKKDVSSPSLPIKPLSESFLEEVFMPKTPSSWY